MNRRAIIKFEPRLEQIEAKQLLSAGAASIHGVTAAIERGTHADAASAHGAQGRTKLPQRFYVFRLTNPTVHAVNLIPPFGQVLVQKAQPKPGQVYNVNFVAVKNGTVQTFNASNGFTVRLTNQGKIKGFPVLTGSQEWKPNKWIVFYVLTKKYYPVSFVAGGFQLDLGGRSSTLVPGPSGIFLRLKYNPATFARTLNWIVAYGQGAELGKGAALGLPDTAINQLVAGQTHRMDFAGHF